MRRPSLDLTADALRQRASLERTAHRPWALPRGDWLMGQSWRRLLFAHWRLAPEQLLPLVPPGLRLDTFDGAAWLGVTPFWLTGLRLRGLPPAPLLSRFHEVNVRTYVRAEEKPGILFFSLDTDSPAAALAARRLYRLPYSTARIRARRGPDGCSFESRRLRDGAGLRFTYAADGPPFSPAAGSIEEFLVERYCLYTAARGRLWRAEIHHPPWVISRARAARVECTLAPPGIALDGDPILHLARPQHVLVWPLEPVAARR